MYSQYISTHLREWVYSSQHFQINEAQLESAIAHNYLRVARYLVDHRVLDIPTQLVKNPIVDIVSWGYNLFDVSSWYSRTDPDVYYLEAHTVNAPPYLVRRGDNSNVVTITVRDIAPQMIARYGTPRAMSLVQPRLDEMYVSTICAAAASCIYYANIPVLRAIYAANPNILKNCPVLIGYARDTTTLKCVIDNAMCEIRPITFISTSHVLNLFMRTGACDALRLYEARSAEMYPELKNKLRRSIIRTACYINVKKIAKAYLSEAPEDDIRTAAQWSMLSIGSVAEWIWKHKRDVMESMKNELIIGATYNMLLISVLWLMKHGVALPAHCMALLNEDGNSFTPDILNKIRVLYASQT